jgi:hypothetical protein
MTTLYDSARTVKPATFARGILATAPHYHVDYTATDSAWWAAESARLDAARLDAEVDAMAEEAAAIARLEMGLCC